MKIVLILLVTLSFLQFSCGQKTKLAHILIAPIEKTGWMLAHDNGRIALEKQNQDNLTTVSYQSIFPGQQTQDLVDELVSNGTSIIVFSVNAYTDDVHTAALKYPSVFFIICDTEYLFPDKNVGYIVQRTWEGEYLSGIIAGMVTQTNALGFIACCKQPDLFRDANAYAIGIDQVNKNVTIFMDYINSFYNESKEFAEATRLVQVLNVDVMTQQTESLMPMMAAKVEGKLAFGWAVDMQTAVGPEVITSLVIDWVVALQYQLDLYRSGNWKDTTASRINWGVKEGLIKMAPFSDLFVPSDHSEFSIYERELARFQAGNGSIFCGHYARTMLSPTIPQGECLSYQELRGINNLLPNIVDDNLTPVGSTIANTNTNTNTNDDETQSGSNIMFPFVCIVMAALVAAL